MYSPSIISAIYHHERSIPCRNFIKNLSQLARNLPPKTCAELFLFIKKIINSPDFIHRHRQKPTDFSRKRKLPAHALIAFLISFRRGSYQNELDRFFNILHRCDTIKRVVSKAAFSKARIKLKYFQTVPNKTKSWFKNWYRINRLNS